MIYDPNFLSGSFSIFGSGVLKIHYDDVCTAYLPETIKFDKANTRDYGKTRLVLSETDWGTVVWLFYTVYNEDQVQMAKALGTTLQDHNKKNFLEILGVQSMHSDYLVDFQGKYKGTEFSFTTTKGITCQGITFQNKNVVFFLAVGTNGKLPQKDYYDYFINSLRVK